MHVLLIHQAFACPEEAGGTRHFEFARFMAAQAHEFTVIASDINYLTGKNSLNSRDSEVRNLEVEGIHVVRAYAYPSLHRSFVWRVFSFITFMISSFLAGLRTRRVDIVMGTSPPLFQALSSWLLAAVKRRPFLLEIRDLWPEFAIGLGVLKHPVLIWLSRRLERFLYDHATHILVNSPAYRDFLARRGVSEGKISLIPNGADPVMFAPEATNSRDYRKAWSLDKKFVVAYAGALGLANDIPTILRAAKRLQDNRDIHFVFVGDGKERPRLDAMANALGLKNVTFLGARPKREMPGILAAVDVCVASLKDIPMFRATYPNKVFDYMAAGRPIVLAIDGVIREVVEAARGGIFVSPGDDRAMAEAVLYLANHREEAERMGQRGRAYVIDHFNRMDQARAFVHLAESLCVRS